VTAALVHSCGMTFSLQPDELCFSEPIQTQEASSIERLPEENVSIVETLEGREERPETVRAITNGTARRKLYFNPAYFEPELLIVSYRNADRQPVCIFICQDSTQFNQNEVINLLLS
jgi:hypothetical protein